MSYAPPEQAPAKSGSPFDIRLRLFRISLRIKPSFWIWNAIWGVLIYVYVFGMQWANPPIFHYILVWLAVYLVTALTHELGHAITARIFGAGTDIVLSGQGGNTVDDYPDLSVWKRLIVIAMGPIAGFALVALVVFFDPFTSNWNFLMDTYELHSLKLNWCIVDKIDPLLRINRPPFYIISLWLLLGINLFLNVFQLFPIIPNDGGMFMREVFCFISPKQGLKAAFGVSVVVATGFTLLYLVIVLGDWHVIPRFIHYPFLFPLLTLIMFAMMAYRCFSAYRELAAKERHSLYRDYDD